GRDDRVDDELQRPRLEQPEGDLGEERDEATGDDPAVRPQVRPQEAVDAPERGRDGPELGGGVLPRHQGVTATGRPVGYRAVTGPDPRGTESRIPAAASDRSTTCVHV